MTQSSESGETPLAPEQQAALSVPASPINIWGRIKEHKVAQWTLAYAAAAYTLLHGTEMVSNAFEWPHLLVRIVTLLLILGLPLVITIAWYHGHRAQRRVGRVELTIITVLLVIAGTALWQFGRPTREHAVAKVGTTAPPPATAAATDNSIAVLPFLNMSPDKEQEYFADGISEELLNLLAQMPKLRVIARTSSFSFKGKDVDIAEIAGKLNVTNVLQGSVRKSGDTLRITAQLVRASDSSYLWSQKYDRKMSDVFGVQDEIAAAVVAQLKIKLLGAAPKPKVTDPQAYALFLQAREAMRQYNPEGFEQAIALYKQALAIDPTYAPAWDGLADAYYTQVYFGASKTEWGLPLAREAIQQALATDPGYAPAYARVAMIEGEVERDLTAASRHLEQGLALDPANLDVISSAGWIARRLGRLEEAVELTEYLVARDPVNPQGHDRLAYAYIFLGRLDEALAEFRTVLKLSPGSTAIHEQVGEVLLLKGDAEAALAEIQQEPAEIWRLVGLPMAYHALGRKADSDAALDELIAKYEQEMPMAIAYVLAYRGEADRAFEWLDKSVKEVDLGLGALPFEPFLESLHSDPRWLPLLRRLNMAPEQLAAIKFDVTVPK
jgi:TolB-like protein/thioredoxin-like negative regulator of GroEL